jgi:DUF4097 and DUF4098 domain-containing protein YvlB
MDENVMRVLQMLQEGKISAQEAEMLIAALRGETTGQDAAEAEGDKKDEKEEKSFLGGFDFDKIKAPKVDFESLGDKISKAVSKVQPEKIVKRVQTQLRTVTRAGAHWGVTVSTRMKTWNDGEDSRPVNKSELPEHSETHEQEFHLDAEASVLIENPLGDVKVIGIVEGPASVTVNKIGWSARAEDVKTVVGKMEVTLHGTDARLDIKVSAPELFREGTVDIELRVPRNIAIVRANTRFGTVEIAETAGQAEAVTTTGLLDVHDLAGDVRGETVSGKLKLLNIAGLAKVATQSGDITAENIGRGLSASAASGDVTAAGVEGGRVEVKSVSGDASLERAGLKNPVDIAVESISGDATLKEANGRIALKAVSGDVTAEGIVATQLQAQTVSGDVHLKLKQPFSDTMQVNTVSGDVTIALPEGSNVRVSLATSSGELRCEHDAHDVTATETLWAGQIGTGAGTLNVQTISGDSHILRASAEVSETL